MSSPPPLADVPTFLAGEGEVAALTRSIDWPSNPLGMPDDWPEALKTTVGIMLNSKFPMFVAWGPELRMLYNDGYAEILGDKHPAALGHSFEDVWAEIWEDLKPIVGSTLSGEAIFWENLPLTMRRRGYPEQTWFTFSYSPLHEDGSVAGIFCVCTETTAMVLAERQRIEEAERLRQLFDHAPGFMAVLRGPDHVFELMNASYLQLVGHRDIVGKSVREALPEIAGQGFYELLDEVYRSGRPFTGHSMPIKLQRAPDAPAEDRLVDFVFQPIVGDGAVTGIFAEGYDVTERHTAELALRESEERFRLIADSAPVPMWVTKLDRKRSFVNRAYVEFLGINYEEAVDFDWRGVLHPEDAPRIVQESIAGEAGLKPFALEARYWSGGKWRWVRSTSQPRWGPSGEHAGFIGVAHDITESKEAEAALRSINETLEKRVAERTADLSAALDRLQAEVGERLRAEEALRQAQKMEAVGQLTGGIAHDFNNLLTPILGGLEIIASRTEDARLKRIAETALESTRRGAKLTGQLLAFSRIQRISMAPIAVNDVIANMQDLLRHTIGRDIGIETRLSADVSHAICDANQLENALLNLAINARDAMPEGGTLAIETELTSVSGKAEVADGGYVRISVSDTGSGMSKEVLARATEPFYSTKPLGKGTGLGLAQVYGIARQSGGTLSIASEPGAGTRVSILLPAAQDDGQPQAQGEAGGGLGIHAAAGEGGKVLVVDDDADVRAFLRDSLAGLGYETEEADGAAAAMAAVERQVPDLVLLDYAMPGMHGADAAREMRSRHPKLPIVFVTGYAESSQLDSALGSEVPVLRKPFTIADLAATVKRNLAATPPA